MNKVGGGEGRLLGWVTVRSPDGTLKGKLPLYEDPPADQVLEEGEKKDEEKE